MIVTSQHSFPFSASENGTYVSNEPSENNDGMTFAALLKKAENELASAFIVSDVEIVENSGDLEIKIEKAQGEKCERCWVISDTVGHDSEHPTLCSRCCENLK